MKSPSENQKRQYGLEQVIIDNSKRAKSRFESLRTSLQDGDGDYEALSEEEVIKLGDELKALALSAAKDWEDLLKSVITLHKETIK